MKYFNKLVGILCGFVIFSTGVVGIAEAFDVVDIPWVNEKAVVPLGTMGTLLALVGISVMSYNMDN
jgi:hypothetical protein